MVNMYNNCSVNCQEEQARLSDNNVCFRFPVFEVENVPQELIVFNCIVNVMVLITAIVGNLLVLYVAWKTPSLRSPSIVLLCGLATTDLAVGLVVQPLFLSMELMPLLSNSAEYHCNLGKAFITMSYWVCDASLSTIVAISVDRLFALSYHLRYNSIVTVPRVLCVLTLNWLTGGFLASLILWSGDEVFLAVMAVAVAIFLCMSTYAHVKIYLVVRRHKQQIQTQAKAVQACIGNGFNMARFKKSVVNAFLVHYVLLFCYTPLFITLLLTSNDKRADSALLKKSHIAIAWKLTTTVVFINSSVNPFIYCWRLRQLRVAVKGTLKKFFCGSDFAAANPD